jgi:hypothetical protein
MIQITLTIDGKPVTLDETYALRFGGARHERFCDLYIGGKRVVKKWSIVLHAEREEDAHGDNANTA